MCQICLKKVFFETKFPKGVPGIFHDQHIRSVSFARDVFALCALRFSETDAQVGRSGLAQSPWIDLIFLDIFGRCRFLEVPTVDI